LRQPERRFLTRTSLQIPLRFRPGAKAGPEWTCQTINVSMLGAYFSADVAPDVGELVQVFIEIPEEVSGKPTAQYCFTARVIHAEKDRPVVGKIGVGVNFYSYMRVEKSGQR
jgi:PilZ domain